MRTERTFYLGVIAALVAIIFFLYTCNKPKPCPQTTKPGVVSVKADTTKKPVNDSTGWHIPIVQQTGHEKPSRPYPSTQFDTLYLPQLVDTAAILAEYYVTRSYSDTNSTSYGNVIIQNEVQQNRLTKQRVLTNLTIPEVTKTVTEVRQEKRTQVYLGVSAQGIQQDPLTAFGASVLLKTKQDKLYEVAALYDKSGHVIYQAGIKFKLSLKK